MLVCGEAARRRQNVSGSPRSHNVPFQAQKQPLAGCAEPMSSSGDKPGAEVSARAVVGFEGRPYSATHESL